MIIVRSRPFKVNLTLGKERVGCTCTEEGGGIEGTRYLNDRLGLGFAAHPQSKHSGRLR